MAISCDRRLNKIRWSTRYVWGDRLTSSIYMEYRQVRLYYSTSLVKNGWWFRRRGIYSWSRDESRNVEPQTKKIKAQWSHCLGVSRWCLQVKLAGSRLHQCTSSRHAWSILSLDTWGLIAEILEAAWFWIRCRIYFMVVPCSWNCLVCYGWNGLSLVANYQDLEIEWKDVRRINRIVKANGQAATRRSAVQSLEERIWCQTPSCFVLFR